MWSADLITLDPQTAMGALDLLSTGPSRTASVAVEIMRMPVKAWRSTYVIARTDCLKH